MVGHYEWAHLLDGGFGVVAAAAAAYCQSMSDGCAVLG